MTERQLQFLDFIRSEIEEKGIAPTYEEMRVRFGMASRAGVYRVLQELLRAGKVRRTGKGARSVAIPNASLAGVATGSMAAELKRRGALEPAVALARFDEAGQLQLAVFGDGPIRFLVVDERTPHDRVYEITVRLPIEELPSIVPTDSPIGTKNDPNHHAKLAVLRAAENGEPHLRSVR